MKTAFLLMMATAKRVSEIHALAMDTEHLRFDKTDGSVSLRIQTGFLAKNQLPWKSHSTIFIPNLAKTLNRENDNRLLCPVRALKCYMDKTKAIRKNRTRLSIPINGDITKGSIARWIAFTIKTAYRKVTMSFLKIKAHELRSLSTSWAYFNSIPIEEVIRAAVWSNQTTFVRFYLRDMHRQQHNLRLLGPVVAAQKVVRGRMICLSWILILSGQLSYTWNQIIRGNRMVLIVKGFRDWNGGYLGRILFISLTIGEL